MNKLLIYCLLMTFLSCTNKSEKIISKDDAISTLRSFFDSMDIDNLGNKKVYDYTTKDFVIFEMGDKYDLETFLEIVKTHFKKGYISTEWKLFDHKVTIDDNSAHISYFNKGKFVFVENGITKEENTLWMESVYLIYEDDKLKLSFLQSDDITKEIIEITK
ncbi:MAG: hypothetical protein L7S44_07910 [Flavobacteriaceae bacterium]|nr:hypothetical protein [Flavobacteriaceae bacterium]